jgi:hypothetical protein
MRKNKNCFRDLARESLVKIALVLTEIEEKIVLLQESELNPELATGLEKFSKTELGSSLQNIGDLVAAGEETVFSAANMITDAAVRSANLVSNILLVP